MYKAVQDVNECRECVREEMKEIGWKKWIWSVWDAKMIQKHEQYNPEHKTTKDFGWE